MRQTELVLLFAESTTVALPRHAELMGITCNPVMSAIPNAKGTYLHFIFNKTFEGDRVSRTFKRVGNGIEIPDSWIWLGPAIVLPDAIGVFNSPVWHVFEEVSQ